MAKEGGQSAPTRQGEHCKKNQGEIGMGREVENQEQRSKNWNMNNSNIKIVYQLLFFLGGEQTLAKKKKKN